MTRPAPTVTAYLREEIANADERALLLTMMHCGVFIDLRPPSHLNREARPSADFVWSDDGLAGVPPGARSLPFFKFSASLITEDAGHV